MSDRLEFRVGVRRRARRVAGAGALLAIAFAGFAIGAWSAPSETPHLTPAKAATFHLRSLGGNEVDLADLLTRGPVVLDFWATWCQPCAQALPEMQRVAERWSDRGVTVVGVSIDGPRNQSRVRPFAAKLGLTFPILFDADGKLQRDYQVSAVPTTVVIDTRGRIAYASEGWWPGETKKIENVLATLLPDSSPAQP